MHELSIAQAIVAIVADHADGRRVTSVEIEVGELRQVVPSALEFGFELAACETEMEGARLVIHTVPVEGRCRSCGRRSRQQVFPLRCGACGELDPEIVSGEELSVVALEVSDEQSALEEIG